MAKRKVNLADAWNVVYSDGRNTLTSGYPDLLNRTLAIKATRLLRF